MRDGLARVRWNNIDKDGYFIGKGIVENVFAIEKAKEMKKESGEQHQPQPTQPQHNHNTIKFRTILP
jgi:hypothetical protein